MSSYQKSAQTSKKTKTHIVCSFCNKKRLVKFFTTLRSRKCNTCKAKAKRLKNKPKSDRRRLIREMDDLVRGYIKTLPDTCCCCGKTNLGSFHPKNKPYGIQVGHFISREVLALRWDLKNCNQQCSGCNKKHQYNQLNYINFMIKNYGVEVLNEFYEIEKNFKHTISKIPISKLKEIKQKLEEKINEKKIYNV